jgi:hypothetical protein
MVKGWSQHRKYSLSHPSWCCASQAPQLHFGGRTGQRLSALIAAFDQPTFKPFT